MRSVFVAVALAMTPAGYAQQAVAELPVAQANPAAISAALRRVDTGSPTPKAGDAWLPLRPPRAGAHARFAQHRGGVPVLGGQVIAHPRAGRDDFALSGASVADFATPTTPEALPPDCAVRAALALHRGRGGAGAPRVLAAPRRVYVNPGYPRRGGAHRLAYEVRVGDGAPESARVYYLDAGTALPLTAPLPLTLHGAVPAVGTSTYYGPREVLVDSVGVRHFELRDPTRGGLEVRYAREGPPGAQRLASRDLDAAGAPPQAVDLLYGAAAFYDLLAERFGWLGIDGDDGRALTAEISLGADFVNAYWNGEAARFGDGDCHYGPLTSLDVVGHEFAHGLIQYTAGLAPAGEPGALAEGLCDILGKALQHAEQPDAFTWRIAGAPAASPYAPPLRELSDPRAREHPSVYRGPRWSDDDADVHANSAPLGRWFVLLVDGGAGVNELGDAYAVAPIGWDAATEHVFHLLRDYLTPTSGYADAYHASLELAATTHSGLIPSDRTSLREAWRAIGLTERRVGRPATTTRAFHDLRLVNRGELRVCGVGEPLTLGLPLRNAGDSLALAGAELRFAVELTPGGYRDTLRGALADNLSPGRVGQALVHLGFAPDSAGAYRLRASLLTPDDRAEVAPVDVAVDVRDAGDLRTDLLLYEPELACHGEPFAVRGVSRQYGCSELPAGTYPLYLADRDGRLLDTVAAELTAVPGAGFLRVRATLEPTTDLAVVTSARLDLSAYGVPEHAWPRSRFRYRPRAVIRDSARTLVGSRVPRGDTFRISAPYLTPGVGVVDYRGRDFWATQGWQSAEDALPCPAAEDVGRRHALVASRLDACVDFAAQPGTAHELTFEVLALHGRSATASDDSLRAGFHAVEVAWGEDPQYDTAVVHQNLPDGRAIRVAQTLPSGYRGPVRVRAFAHLGDGSADIDAHPVRGLDYVLVRDVRIGPSRAPATADGSQLVVYPSPASDWLAVESSGAAAERALVITDDLGRVVGWVPGQGFRRWVDVSDLADGIYTVRLAREGGGGPVARFAVVR